MSAPDFFSDLDLDEVPSMAKAQVPDFFSDIEEQPISSRSMSLKLPRETPDFFENLEDSSLPLRKQSTRFDPVSAELRRVGHEPDFGEELERAGEFGIAEGLRGLVSGATAGISERVPSLKPEEGIGSDVYRFVGSFLPISILGKGIGLVANLAKSSPIAPKALSAISKIAGWGVGGATYGTIEDLARHGEMPTAEKIAKDGLIWGGIEAALMGVGKLVSFTKNLIKYSKEKKIPRLEALEEVVDSLKENKIDPVENPEEAVTHAEEFLQTPKVATEEVEQPAKQVLSQKIEVKPRKLEIEAIEPSSEKVKTEAKEIKSIPAEKRTPEQTQVVALSEQAQPGDPAEKLFENVPLPDKPSIIERVKKSLLKPKTDLSKQLNELKQDYFSKKWGLEWDNRHKWDKLLEKKKFSNKELSDMMFYVENPEAFGGKKTERGTGNPFVSPEDTFEALEKRLSPESKAIVNGVVTPHFKQWVKTINESGYAKKINPRDFLEGVYIPHFYSGDSKKGAKQAAELLSKRFSTNNPFANMRTFMTYNEALQKAGMKPRFDNIADLLNEYDRVMTRVLVNSEFAGKIADLEKEIGSKLIVRSNSPKYAEAKKEGWVPFDDPYLRRYVAGKSEEGKPIFATLETPALVHPEAADAFTGIFIKDAQKPNKSGEMALWKGFDAISDLLKSMHVSLSGFHYLTLAEESGKSSGINLINNFRRGGKLLDDPVFMRDYVQAGGVVGHNPELLKKAAYNTKSIEQALVLSGGPKKQLGDAIKGVRDILQIPSKFLFEEFQPRLKVAAFHDMRARYLKKLNKKGIVPDSKQMKQINKELASLSNDMFGGQRFELMQNPTNFKMLDFNDPEILKGWKRAGGYVDWTASAMREFGKTAKGLAEIFPGVEKTPTGTAARQNALRYARNLFIATQMLNYFTTGLSRDKEGKLIWDASKAHSTFENEDSSKNALDIALPDIEVDIAGHKFNLGKDEKGRRLYSHFGKKLLENFHWVKDPIKQLFNKGNPVWQTLFVQAAGGTPSLEGIFFAESAYKQGRQQPWEGKKGWSTLEPRVRHMLKMAAPYSLSPTIERGALPGIMQFLTTGLGTLPVSKGMNLTKAEDFYDQYLHNEKKYEKDILILDKVLKDNGYQDKQIKSLKTRVRNRIEEEKE